MKLSLSTILLFGCILLQQALYAQDQLPEKVHTSIDKILDDHLAEIENTIIQENEFETKTVLLVTVPLENFIEDVLFTINRPAVIYPKILYKVIRDQFRQGKSREEIERLLVTMQKQNKFEKLYVAEKQK
ncbi:MAG: hypothetical protein WCX28_09640 [Bacteriovoracaceae bacterium]|nr:hypothetical protein [Bacteroidota bacterium]